MARNLEDAEIPKCREEGVKYVPFEYANGNIRKQLLARAKYILTKHESKWTKSQRWRADIIFEFYPELKRAYELAILLTDIFNKKCIKDVARTKPAKWFNEVEKLAGNAFQTVIDTFVNHYDTYWIFSSTGKPMQGPNHSMQRSWLLEVSSGEWLTFRSSCSDLLNSVHENDLQPTFRTDPYKRIKYVRTDI